MYWGPDNGAGWIAEADASRWQGQLGTRKSSESDPLRCNSVKSGVTCSAVQR
jgi:hypothetical protein